MGKRNKVKRSHLRAFSAERVHGGKRPNPDMISLYQNSVKSISGPKNKSEPVLDNSYTRPVKDGVAGRLRCTECGTKYYTTIQWDQHLRKFPSSEWPAHEQVFEPDLKRGHFLADVANSVNGPVIFSGFINHSKIPTPLKEVQKNLRVWQSQTRQGFTEWRWTRLIENRGAVLYLGFNGAEWKFKRTFPDGTEKFSIHTYRDKAHAMWYWDNLKIVWA